MTDLTRIHDRLVHPNGETCPDGCDQASKPEGVVLNDEYDSAAEWCAKRGLRGVIGDPLPPNLSASAMMEIAFDSDAFECRVRETAYMLAMESRQASIEAEAGF